MGVGLGDGVCGGEVGLSGVRGCGVGVVGVHGGGVVLGL